MQMAKWMSYVTWFFVIYLGIYATCLWLSVMVGGYKLYARDRMKLIRNQLSHDFYFPISILVPAYNEAVTIVDTVTSLLGQNYRLYEIVVIDDGSKDETAQVLIDHFGMIRTQRPMRMKLPCQPVEAIYEAQIDGIKVTLIRKVNGGKGDALNMGINAAQNPYFVCMDADSMLQTDSLEQIVRPLLEDDRIVAVGGLVRIAQGVKFEGQEVVGYRFPWHPLIGVQIVEYARSFFASRILMDCFNGNLIISGAFGLFKKDVVIAAGGYASDTLGEDMELVVRLHVFCKNNQMDYAIRYEPRAVCWSQAPSGIRDLITQRRRWHLGLFQSMVKYRQLMGRTRFGMLGMISYMYYLCFELAAPYVEVFGVVMIVVSGLCGLLNMQFLIQFTLSYGVYNALLTLTAYLQCMYMQKMKLPLTDVLKVVLMCIVEALVVRYILAFVRLSAFFGYKKRKQSWGHIQRYAQYKQ